MKTTTAAAASSLALALLLAACAPADEAEPQAAPPATDGASASASSDPCSKDALKTRAAGKLTVGTDDPAYEPWFSDNDPSNGKGFESAVAYAVAERLGFGKDEVTWTKVPFNNIVKPGRKSFDVDINQVSITDERKGVVDFSSGYYDVRQTVIALKSGKLASATSVADLEGAKLGAQVGTTSLQTVTDVIKPSTKPSVFDTNDIAKAALKNGQVDGLVVDLPTAFYITGAELPEAKIVGQLPASSAGPDEQFGMVLEKGSPLTACVTKAVDALREDGTLRRLEQQWLSQTAGAPELT